MHLDRRRPVRPEAVRDRAPRLAQVVRVGEAGRDHRQQHRARIGVVEEALAGAVERRVDLGHGAAVSSSSHCELVRQVVAECLAQLALQVVLGRARQHPAVDLADGARRHHVARARAREARRRHRRREQRRRGSRAPTRAAPRARDPLIEIAVGPGQHVEHPLRRGQRAAAPARTRRCAGPAPRCAAPRSPPSAAATRGRRRRAPSPPPAASPSARTRSAPPRGRRPAPAGRRRPRRWRSRRAGRAARRTSQRMPTSATPSSSSACAMNSRSPFGRKPLRARIAIVTARVAVWFFMSTAPRPHSQPSSSTWPANGGCVQSGSSAGTTSVWPHSASDGPSPVPRDPGDQVRPVDHRARPARTRPRRPRGTAAAGAPRAPRSRAGCRCRCGSDRR